MGTRNLVCVVLNKKFKVAQYGQWDGYLDGQGKIVVNFIANEMNLSRFKRALSECRFVSQKESEAIWNAGGHAKEALSRDRGADILQMIQDGTYQVYKGIEEGRITIKGKPVRLLCDQKVFAKESLLCEYAYVLDLDKEILEVYKGFNTSGKCEGRFKHMKPSDTTGEYGTITLLTTMPFAEVKQAGALDKLKAIEIEKYPPEKD